MGYSAVWKVLEEIVIEFRKKKLEMPEKVMTNLRSAKTMIRLLDTVDKDKGEMAPKLEQCLTDVEAYLITEAQKSFPQKLIDEWLQRLNQATCDVCTPAPQVEEKTRFVSGVPRDQKWVRVKPIASLSLTKLKKLAEETELSFRPDKDNHLIVYGKSENIKEFIKKMTDQTGKESENLERPT